MLHPEFKKHFLCNAKKLACDLSEQEFPPYNPISVEVADAEEILRDFMVCVYPKLKRGKHVHTASASLELLRDSAQKDIRFFDAFNHYYEYLKKNNKLLDKSELSFLSAYQFLIEHWIEKMEHSS